MMFISTVADDSIYGGIGVQPAVLRQCDYYDSHQPKWLRTANIEGIDDVCKQE